LVMLLAATFKLPRAAISPELIKSPLRLRLMVLADKRLPEAPSMSPGLTTA